MNLRRFMQTGAGRAAILHRRVAAGAAAVALPTTGLTAQFDASTASKLWQSYQAGTPFHNTQATNGGLVRVWDDEAASASLALIAPDDANRPTWRSTSTILPLPCLDFDPAASNRLDLYNDAWTVGGGTLNVFSASQWTALVSFACEGASTDGTYAFQNQTIFGDSLGNIACAIANRSGQLKLQFETFAPGALRLEQNITANTPTVLCVRQLAGTLYLSVNGGAETSRAVGNISGGLMRFGSAAGTVYFNGRMGEIALYNIGLTGQDLTDAIAHFVNKWTV